MRKNWVAFLTFKSSLILFRILRIHTLFEERSKKEGVGEGEDHNKEEKGEEKEAAKRRGQGRRE